MRLSWAKLLKPMFEIDLERGPNCGGELKFPAAILERMVIGKLLASGHGGPDLTLEGEGCAAAGGEPGFGGRGRQLHTAECGGPLGCGVPDAGRVTLA